MNDYVVNPTPLLINNEQPPTGCHLTPPKKEDNIGTAVCDLYNAIERLEVVSNALSVKLSEVMCGSLPALLPSPSSAELNVSPLRNSINGATYRVQNVEVQLQHMLDNLDC